MKSSANCLIAAELHRKPELLSGYLSIAKIALYQLIWGLEPMALHELLLIDEPTVYKIGEDPFPSKMSQADGSN
jgi:hypothetical protein